MSGEPTPTFSGGLMNNNLWLPPTKRTHREATKRFMSQSGMAPEPNHWHILYAGIPRFSIGYRTQKEAFAEIHRLGQESEPNTEWYEDGRVGIETAIHGRVGLYWVELEVAGCIKHGCEPVDENGFRLPDPAKGPILKLVK